MKHRQCPMCGTDMEWDEEENILICPECRYTNGD